MPFKYARLLIALIEWLHAQCAILPRQPYFLLVVQSWVPVALYTVHAKCPLTVFAQLFGNWDSELARENVNALATAIAVSNQVL